MERSESNETSGTRQREREREGKITGAVENEDQRHSSIAPEEVSPFSSVNSIRRTTDCHWQMLPLSSLSLAFPSPIVKPTDQGVNTGLSPQKLQLLKRKQSPYACSTEASHAFHIFVLQNIILTLKLKSTKCNLYDLQRCAVRVVLFYVIFQDFLPCLWHSLHYQNNLWVLEWYTTAPPSGRERQIKQDVGSLPRFT